MKAGSIAREGPVARICRAVPELHSVPGRMQSLS
jgi:hypothetical protein